MILSANIHGLKVLLVTLKSINMNKATVEIVVSWTAPGDYYSLGVRIINCTGISKTVWHVIMSLNDPGPCTLRNASDFMCPLTLPLTLMFSQNPLEPSKIF